MSGREGQPPRPAEITNKGIGRFGRSKYRIYGPVPDGISGYGFPEIWEWDAAGTRNSDQSPQGRYRTETGSHEDYSDTPLGDSRELYPQESFSFPTIGMVGKYVQRTILGYTNGKYINIFSGKRGMVRAGGQPPGPSKIKAPLTLGGGGSVGPSNRIPLADAGGT